MLDPAQFARLLAAVEASQETNVRFSALEQEVAEIKSRLETIRLVLTIFSGILAVAGPVIAAYLHARGVL